MADRVHRARGRRRREELLRAALRVIDERGVGGATHRAIAQEAGVPVATTTYYFASIDELLEAALELFVEDEIGRLEAVASRVGTHEGTTGELVSAVADEIAVACTPAQFELYVEARRRPALAAVVSRSLAAYRALAEGLLRQVGCPEPERAAPLVVALLDGLGVQHVAVGDERRRERIEDGLVALLAGFGARAPV